MKRVELSVPQIQLFKSILREESLPNLETSDWEQTLPLIEEHKLCGHLYKKAHKNALICERMGKRANQQKYHNVLLMSELESLRPIQAIPLKGAALLKTIYRDWSIRPMSDLDLLVPHDKQAFVGSYLSGMGYIEQRESKWRANRFKSVWCKEHPDFDITVELHFKLFANEPESFKWRIKDHLLGVNHQLVHLIGHFAYQHTMIKLFWLYDIVRFIKENETKIDWLQVMSTCNQIGLSNALDATFFVLHRMVEIEMTPEPFQKRWSALIDWPLLIQTREIPLRYFVLKHALKQGVWDALRYDMGWAAAKLTSR